MTPTAWTDVRTLADLLRWRERHQGDKPAFAFLDHRLRVVATDTYASLARSARAVARQLVEEDVAGDPVLLAYPPGLDFVRAFWGILLSGGIAVPAYPPTDARLKARFRGVLTDSDARVVLAPDAVATSYLSGPGVGPEEAPRRWIDLSRLPAATTDAPRPPDHHVEPARPAIVQYTSGSTAKPRGVVLSHDNILANSRLIYRAFMHTSKSRGLIWLPPYHDMGLIGGIVQPVYGGFRTTLMSSRTFLRDPLNWLKAISMTRATTSGGPDSAYAACLAIPDEDIAEAGIRLDSWQVAFNGAEPVSPRTLDAFVEKFEPFGFPRRRFTPCYGLAEATLYVCGTIKNRRPVTFTVRADALRRNRVRGTRPDAPDGRTFVSHGLPRDAVAIVAPDEARRCGLGEVGEIWVTGASVAHRYWSATEENAKTFGRRLEPDGPAYVRTGDLGFLHMGELYVTGRLKDVIIIRGQNHYPHEIEATARRAHPSVRRLPGAAFSLDPAATEADAGPREALVMVQEVPRQRNPEADREVIEAIRTAVFTEHALAVDAVFLVRRGRLPRTPSGKIQRSDARDALLAGRLEELASWQSTRVLRTDDDDDAEPPRAPEIGPPPDLARRDRDEAAASLKAWLTRAIAVELGTSADRIDPDTHFGLYGLESETAAKLTKRLCDALDTEIEDVVFWDFPNLNLLSEHLIDGAVHGRSGEPQARPG